MKTLQPVLPYSVTMHCIELNSHLIDWKCNFYSIITNVSLIGSRDIFVLELFHFRVFRASYLLHITEYPTVMWPSSWVLSKITWRKEGIRIINFVSSCHLKHKLNLMQIKLIKIHMIEFYLEKNLELVVTLMRKCFGSVPEVFPRSWTMKVYDETRTKNGK